MTTDTTDRERDAAIAGGIMCGDDGCRPISREAAEALWSAAKEHQRKRAEAMPDEPTALRAMVDAYQRLKELGWRDATYAPKDEPIEMLEVGSTGIHRGYRDDIGFWIQDTDTWPSRPVLFRSLRAEAARRVLEENR